MKSVSRFFKEVDCEHGFVKYIGGKYPFHCEECKGCWEHHPHDQVEMLNELISRETISEDDLLKEWEMKRRFACELGEKQPVDDIEEHPDF